MSARARILPVFVPQLGCPHQCVFCNQRRISGAQQPVRAGDVRELLENAAFLPKGEKRQLAFYGGSFTAIPVSRQEELLGAAQPYLQSGVIDCIRLSTRPDAIDDETLERLSRFGVETIELGAQSMDDAVLRISGRGHSAGDVARASGLIRARGFRLILQMMTGLPGSDFETDVETARRLAALRPDGVRVYPTVIVRDTPLFALWQAGQYREHSVEDAVAVCASILPVFEAAGIPVIRLGLNPTEELTAGAAVGGAYHPALGELVKSRVLRNEAEALLIGAAPGESVTLAVKPGLRSQMTGQHRANLLWLQQRFALREVRVAEQEQPERVRVVQEKVPSLREHSDAREARDDPSLLSSAQSAGD